MITTNDVENLVLGMPGMEVTVKFTGSLQCKTILLMSVLLEKAQGTKGAVNDLFSEIPEEVSKELNQFMAECLEKARLVPVIETMKALSSKKQG